MHISLLLCRHYPRKPHQPLPNTSERAVPNRDDELLAHLAFTKPETQTTRRVHRLPAILLRRWQVEEIAKTPSPCVSRIRTEHEVQMNRFKTMLSGGLTKTEYGPPRRSGCLANLLN